jgi:glycosyltransferase involved in cell wall biosynthesis
MTPAVSVIVPAYNAEKYLPECLKGLSSQLLRELEVICVNDGSTDNTRSIMERFAQMDGRFMVLSGKNVGYGAACNKGFAAARGEYIAILESDDFCAPTFYEDMLKIAQQKKCDFVKSDFIMYWSQSKKEHVKLASDKMYGKAFTPRTHLAALLNTYPSPWSAIYRNDFLAYNRIRFLETPGAAYQDTSFAIKVIMLAQTAFLVNKAYVSYRQHPGQSVQKAGNPLAICTEFAEVERCFPMTPQLFAAKFRRYMWNYKRLNESERHLFLARFKAEFRDALSTTFDIMGSSGLSSKEADKLMEIIA